MPSAAAYTSRADMYTQREAHVSWGARATRCTYGVNLRHHRNRGRPRARRAADPLPVSAVAALRLGQDAVPRLRGAFGASAPLFRLKFAWFQELQCARDFVHHSNHHQGTSLAAALSVHRLMPASSSCLRISSFSMKTLPLATAYHWKPLVRAPAST
jgi:hypothetical protein